MNKFSFLIEVLEDSKVGVCKSCGVQVVNATPLWICSSDHEPLCFKCSKKIVPELHDLILDFYNRLNHSPGEVIHIQYSEAPRPTSCPKCNNRFNTDILLKCTDHKKRPLCPYCVHEIFVHTFNEPFDAEDFCAAIFTEFNWKRISYATHKEVFQT